MFNPSEIILVNIQLTQKNIYLKEKGKRKLVRPGHIVDVFPHL